MTNKEFLDDIEKRLLGQIVGPMASMPPKIPQCFAAIASNEEIERLIGIIRGYEHDFKHSDLDR